MEKDLSEVYWKRRPKVKFWLEQLRSDKGATFYLSQFLHGVKYVHFPRHFCDPINLVPIKLCHVCLNMLLREDLIVSPPLSCSEDFFFWGVRTYYLSSVFFRMSGLNVSIIFFFSVVTLCEFARRFFKRIFPPKVYFCLAGELASSFQICACYLELKMLREIGPWGGGFGPDVALTLLFVIFLAHGASFDGTVANPVASLQEFLALDCSFAGSIVKILAQFLGMEAAGAFTKKYWAKEFTHFHMIQNLMAQDCSSSLNTSISQGIFVEAMGSFLFQLIFLKLHTCSSMYRVPIVALSITVLTYTAAPVTGAFFNPALASAMTFSCSGNSLLEYMQVYWLAPISGMLLALFVYQGNIPRFFQKNLLYSQKKKYRIFKGKVTSNSVVEERQTKTEKKNSSSGLIN